MPCMFKEQQRGQCSVAGMESLGLYMGKKIREVTRRRVNCVRPCKWSY